MASTGADPSPPNFDTLATSRQMASGREFDQEQADSLTVALVEATRHLASTDDLEKTELRISSLIADQGRNAAIQSNVTLRWVTGITIAAAVAAISALIGALIQIFDRSQ